MCVVLLIFVTVTVIYEVLLRTVPFVALQMKWDNVC